MATASALALTIAGTTIAQAAIAQSAPAGRIEFNIPAQDLNKALLAFTDRAGLQIFYDLDKVAGKRSNAVRGSYAPMEALSQLLAGTGLTYRQIGNRLTLEPAPQADAGTVQLGTLRVEGASGVNSGAGTGAAGDPADAPYRTAGSDAYISREDIERHPGTSPADIFKSTPGVMSGEARNSGGIDVNIRGLQGYGRVAVTIDGARQESASDRGYAGDANRTLIDPDMISSVSISKGPSNDPDAGGAIAGHVAVKTLTADDIVQPGHTFGVRIKGGFRTNSASPPAAGTVGGLGLTTGSPIVVATNYPTQTAKAEPSLRDGYNAPVDRPGFLHPTNGNGSVAVAMKKGHFEIVAAVSRREQGNYYAGTHGNYARLGVRDGYPKTTTSTVTAAQKASWDQLYPGNGLQVGDQLYRTQMWYENLGKTAYRAGDEVLNTFNTLTSGMLKGTLTLDGGHRLELGYIHSETEYGFMWPTYYRFNATVSNNQPFEAPPSHTKADMVTGKYSYHPDGSKLVDVHLNAWYSHQSVHEYVYSRPSILYETISTNTPMVGFDLSNRSILGDLSLRYGLAYIAQDMNNNYTYTSEVDKLDVTRKQWDVFIDGNWKPADWLEVDVGLRYMTARNRQTVPGATLSDASVESTRTSQKLVSNTGVTVEPLHGLQFYGTYKQGWRAPVAAELEHFYPNASTSKPWYFAGSNPAAYGYTDVNAGPFLKEESSTNYEFGANLLRKGVLRSDDTLGLKLSYFINDIHNYITTIYIHPDTPNLYAVSAGAVNFYRMKSSGVEFSARYASGPFFGQASAIWYDKMTLCPTAQQCFHSGTAEGLPWNLWRNQTPPAYSWSIHAGLHLFDQRLTLDSRVTRNGRVAGYGSLASAYSYMLWDPQTLVDLSGSFAFSKAVSLDVAVENLFDRYYIDPLANVPQPGPGRTLRVNMSVKF